MAKAKGPLFSEAAQKQLGKAIIFKVKDGKTFVTKYNKPGDRNSFSPSVSQIEKREIYTAAVREWRLLTDGQKEAYNNIVKQKNLKMSGWNYYYKLIMINPECFFGIAFYGKRCYGRTIYGNEEY